MSAPIHEVIIASRTWGITSMSALCALAILAHQEPKLSSLAFDLHLSSAAITQLADRLVEQRYLERLNETRLGQDRRKVRLVITDAGRHALHCINNGIHAPKPVLASH